MRKSYDKKASNKPYISIQRYYNTYILKSLKMFMIQKKF